MVPVFTYSLISNKFDTELTTNVPVPVVPVPVFTYLLKSVDILTITDFDHLDDQHFVLNGIQNAIATLADSISLEAGQF